MVETKTVQQTNNTAVNTTQFSGMGFVGIKKVEYFSKEEESVVFSDILELLENRNYANNLMLGFFSVKPFGTEKVEKIDSIISMNEESNDMMIKQSLKKAALFDFAEAETTSIDEVNIIVVADCIIHWDAEGSYIQPTQENAINLDLEDIVKLYSPSYKITIYSQRDLSTFTYREFKQKSIFDVPVKSNMWYNQPTFQQIYGNTVLTAGLITMALAYGALSWQEGKLEDLRSKASSFRTQNINESFYTSSNTEFQELTRSVDSKNLLSIITKDISNSLSRSGFKLDSISLSKNIEDGTVLVEISSKEDSHTQFSVQEPLAQRVLENSSTIKAIKKKTVSDARLVLEALVDIREVKNGLKVLKQGEL
jgi:hypothetical protein